MNEFAYELRARVPVPFRHQGPTVLHNTLVALRVELNCPVSQGPITIMTGGGSLKGTEVVTLVPGVVLDEAEVVFTRAMAGYLENIKEDPESLYVTSARVGVGRK